jgi:hypothetical protein
MSTWDKDSGIESVFGVLRRGEDIFATYRGLRKLDKFGYKWNPITKTNQVGVLAPGSNASIMSVSGGLGPNGGRLTQFAPDGRILAMSDLPVTTSPDLSLATDRDGGIWLGRDGISKAVIRGKEFALYPEDVPRNGVPDIRFDDSSNILWACDGNDVVFHREGSWGRISSQDGLLNLPCAALATEANGDLWVGYEGGAVSWISHPDSGHPVVHNETQWLNTFVANRGTHLLAVDHRGWVWLGMDVLRLATAAAAKAGDWLQLDERDGLAPPQAAGDPIFVDSDNSVWFGTSTGVAHLSLPEDFLTRFPPPPVFISGFSVAGGNATPADAMTNVPRDSSVIAHIGSLQFDRRNALHLRYRLLPQQGKWTGTTQFDIPLSRLSWGHHTLQVQAQLATGPWSEAASATFDVPPPMWATWPALLGMASGCGVLFAGGRRLTRKRRERKQKSFPKLEEWRLAALSPEVQQFDGELLDSRFEVGRVLARGGFAVVAEGRDLQQDGRRCAIKVFRKELVDKEWMRRRFNQEVRALSQIVHPNVVRIYGSGTLPQETLYLVMEFIEGATLRELLERGTFDFEKIPHYLRQAGRALDEIHEHGICHRDLKPENIMIRANAPLDEELVLIDFSIAIVKDPDETLHGLSRAAGTIYYMAPEQAIGYADPSTDIYSLTKILIEMLTGERLSALLPDASMDLPDRVRELLTRLPLGLSSLSIELIASALVFDPAHRPKKAGPFAFQIANDLESIRIA